MKFDERDIKAIASGRFWRKRQWVLIGSMFIAIFIALPIAIFVKEPLGWIAVLPILAWLGYMTVLTFQQNKREKALLKKWQTEKEK